MSEYRTETVRLPDWNYNAGNGATTYDWTHNGTATPFTGAAQILTNQTTKKLGSTPTPTRPWSCATSTCRA